MTFSLEHGLSVTRDTASKGKSSIERSVLLPPLCDKVPHSNFCLVTAIRLSTLQVTSMVLNFAPFRVAVRGVESYGGKILQNIQGK